MEEVIDCSCRGASNGVGLGHEGSCRWLQRYGFL